MSAIEMDFEADCGQLEGKAPELFLDDKGAAMSKSAGGRAAVADELQPGAMSPGSPTCHGEVVSADGGRAAVADELRFVAMSPGSPRNLTSELNEENDFDAKAHMERDWEIL